MPDKRKHRGPNPLDHELFSEAKIPVLREAVADLAWLRSRGYADVSSLQIVGDRYGLTRRQRNVVGRSCCNDAQMSGRISRKICVAKIGEREGDLSSQHLLIDGFNVLITVEVALSGGLIYRSRDTSLRDIASIHGTFRTVEETQPAIGKIGDAIERLGFASCVWYFDRPVSNSGRICSMIREMGEQQQWSWRVQLENDPDPILRDATECVATSDSVILDGCAKWIDLPELALRLGGVSYWFVDLAPANLHGGGSRANE